MLVGYYADPASSQEFMLYLLCRNFLSRYSDLETKKKRERERERERDHVVVVVVVVGGKPENVDLEHLDDAVTPAMLSGP
jgi:predicted RNA-binding protein associated with RNAse of E/G family